MEIYATWSLCGYAGWPKNAGDSEMPTYTRPPCEALIALWSKFKQLHMFTIEERDKIYQSARSELESIPSPKESDTDPPVSITPTECTTVAGPSVKFSQWENVDDQGIAVDDLNA